MTTNLKAETLINIPLLLPDNETNRLTQLPTPARRFRIGWLVPSVAVAAAIVAYVAFQDLAETNASMDQMAAFLQTPQF